MTVCVICSGNICRSPLAEGVLRRCLSREGLDHVRVLSAGTLGIDGRPAAVETLQVAESAGIDLSQHRSRGVTDALLRAVDVAIVMTRDHLAELERRFPDGSPDRFLLRSFEEGATPSVMPEDLVDPIGRSMDTFESQLPIIETSMKNFARWLKHHSTNREG